MPTIIPAAKVVFSSHELVASAIEKYALPDAYLSENIPRKKTWLQTDSEESSSSPSGKSGFLCDLCGAKVVFSLNPDTGDICGVCPSCQKAAEEIQKTYELYYEG